jgi:hypothetical protein
MLCTKLKKIEEKSPSLVIKPLLGEGFFAICPDGL